MQTIPTTIPATHKNAVPHYRNTASGSGAGDATRTRDHLLGRQMLYQLSYTRE